MFFAHRGGVGGIPWLSENSLEAFSHAMKGPWDGIEFDVRITADRVVVIHHDETSADGRRISECAYNDLCLPRLEELLTRVVECNYEGVMIIDVKTYQTMNLVVALLDAFAISPGRVVISSFLHPEVERVSANAEWPWICAWTTECFPCNLDDQLSKGRILLLCYSSIDWHDKDVLEKLQQNADQIVIWTVNDGTLATQCLEMGLSVISDTISVFIPVRS